MDRSDSLVVAAVTGAALAGLAVGSVAARPAMYDVPPWVLALALVQGGVLWWRRTRPVAVLLAAAVAVLAIALLRHPSAGAALGPLAATYALGAHAGSRWSWAWLLPVVVPLSAAGAGVGFSTGREPDPVAMSVSTLVLYGAVFLAGRLVRARREAAVQRTRAAVAEERSRIARELHDVVAHHVGVITLHAGAGRRLVDRDPEAAERAFVQIEESGRAALEAMPALVGGLRGGTAVSTPQPTLADLERLVDGIVGAGQQVRLDLEGERRPLPAAVELSGYRIIQESLTNAARHAGPARVTVRVRWMPAALEIEVEDDGRGGQLASAGFGLTGIRERVAVLGGSHDIGPRPGGGFAVRARLPLSMAES